MVQPGYFGTGGSHSVNKVDANYVESLGPGDQPLKLVRSQVRISDKERGMKKGGFSEEQIIGILKRHEAGQKVADLAREHGISEATIYTWKGSTAAWK